MKILYNIAGSISLVLAILGIFLPLLPTTPFLLLTASCYYRGSKKMHDWLMNHKIFGKYITDYIEKKAISSRIKTKAIIVLWITMSITAIFFVNSIWIHILLLIVAIGVTIHLVSLNSLDE